MKILYISFCFYFVQNKLSYNEFSYHYKRNSIIVLLNVKVMIDDLLQNHSLNTQLLHLFAIIEKAATANVTSMHFTFRYN